MQSCSCWQTGARPQTSLLMLLKLDSQLNLDSTNVFGAAFQIWACTNACTKLAASDEKAAPAGQSSCISLRGCVCVGAVATANLNVSSLQAERLRDMRPLRN